MPLILLFLLCSSPLWAQDSLLWPLSKPRHLPQQPRSGDTVRLTIKVLRKVQGLQVYVQRVQPGQYIARNDAAYLQNWAALALNDAGKDGDQQAGDSIFTALVPRAWQQHRHLIRYRFEAQDAQGQRILAPHAQDEQANYAYFVYDGPAPYAEQDFAELPPVPQLILLAKAEDVRKAVFRYRGYEYEGRGTIVHAGKVYDHIGFRSRGFANRHSRDKRNLKINFLPKHRLALQGDYGRFYAEKRDKLVLSGGWLLDQPHSHGLIESVMYRLFTLPGGSASYADYLHFRVIRHEEESHPDLGDFWGIYLALENFDGDFLRTHNLPDGNIYSYKPFKVRHFAKGASTEERPPSYRVWDSLCRKPNTEAWWREHLDLPNFYTFLAAQQAVNNRETGYRGQHWWMEYQKSSDGRWQIFPWDMDMTWTAVEGSSTVGGGIRKALFSHQALEYEYYNHLRSFLDLLFNEEQMNRLIEEEARLIYNFKTGKGFPALDKRRWGHDYRGDFLGQVQALKDYVRARRAYMLQKQLPKAVPPPPKVYYRGTAGYPLDKLRFESSPPPADFGWMEWRVAEVNPPTDSGPLRYEIEAVWTSGRISPFVAELQLMATTLRAGRNYRLRVRHCNSQGLCGHWSEPLSFSPKGLPPAELPLRFSELMYHPSKDCPGGEFIELRNGGSISLALDGFVLTGGVQYRFPPQSTLAPGQYWVLAEDSLAFVQHYGFAANGVYQGKLNNGGETLILLNDQGQVVDSLSYDNKNGWDARADGLGYSLQWLEEGENDSWQHWQASPQPCGSPGKANRPPSWVKSIGGGLKQSPWIGLGLLFLGLWWYWRKKT